MGVIDAALVGLDPVRVRGFQLIPKSHLLGCLRIGRGVVEFVAPRAGHYADDTAKPVILQQVQDLIRYRQRWLNTPWTQNWCENKVVAVTKGMMKLRDVCVCLVSILVLFGGRALAQTEPLVTTNGAALERNSTFNDIWENGVGEGFRGDAQSITLSAGANYGIAAFGSQQAHHLALINVIYGHMLSGVVGQGHWYRGNPEFRLELFTGAQFDPNSEWLVGLTPHFRYNLATGTRWIPYMDLGAGVTATGIGPPDLSGTFEFNLQGGFGIQWFFKDHVALTLDAHYLHISCAGIHKPNLGLNGVTGMLGISFFF